MKQFFVWFCIFCCVFLFGSMTFLTLDYVSEDTFEITDLNGDPVEVSYLRIPLETYLEDNQSEIDHFNYSMQSKFYNAERLGNDFYSTAKGFIQFFNDLNVDIESLDPLSSMYLYHFNKSYKLFVDSYLSNLQKAYEKADFGFFKRVILRYSSFLPDLRDSLIDNVNYAPYFNMNQWSDLNDMRDVYGSLLIDPYLYFLEFNVNPEYHKQIQGLLYSYGITSFCWISDESISGLYPIHILYLQRVEADNDLGFTVREVNSVSTDYYYNPSTHSVQKGE